MRRKDREITDISEIEKIIKAIKICHLAMVDSFNNPYVVPLNFGYEIKDNELTLYFHSAKEGKKLDILAQNTNACFELSGLGDAIITETPCNLGYYFSSVIGYGDVKFIDNVEEKCKALSLIVKHQVDRNHTFNEKQVSSVCVFKIISTEFTAKRKIQE